MTDITGDRWRQLEGLLDTLLDTPVEDRRRVLDERTGDDSSLRHQVEELLASGQQADGFLDGTADRFSASVVDAVETLERKGAGGGPRAGDYIGRYQVVRSIGQGGMGEVYLAHDPRLDRPVAIKILPRILGSDDDARRRFAAEARTASSLDHPNIAPIYETDETDDGQSFIVMAYCEGDTLKERIARGPMDPFEAIDVARQIARGLAAAHAKGIVHRDIKPSNIVIGPHGVVRIIDFGVAKVQAGTTMTHTGTTIGTVAYMSPEQTVANTVDPRSDLWSLGAVLYEAITGERPFQADNQEALIYAIRNDDIRPLEDIVPEGKQLSPVVQACLTRDPNQRVQSAAEVATWLEDLSRGRASSIRLERPRPARPWRRYRKALLWSLGGVAALAVGAILIVRRTGPPIDPGMLPIAVLPPTPLAADTSLTTLGRNLAVAVVTNLERVGRVRVTPAVTVLGRMADVRDHPEPGQALARLVGARSFVEGTLLRTQDNVRVDLAIYATEGLKRLARYNTLVPVDSFVALSDDISLGLLQQIWRRGSPPVPSLEAVTTTSLPALEAYVRGEQAFAEIRWEDAVQWFDSAFAADSTFWFAQWRSAYPRIYEGSSLGERWTGIIEHRHGFPEPDRLMVEARMTDSLSNKMAILHEVAGSFPDYWPGVYDYGNLLLHHAPYLGATYYDDTRHIFDHVVEIQPGFMNGLRHDLWIAIYRRDDALARQILEMIVERRAGRGTELNPVQLGMYEALIDLIDSGGVLDRERLERDVSMVLRMGDRLPPESPAIELIEFGFHGAQIQFNDEAIRQGAPPRVREAHLMGRAAAWAARGAWDSSMATVDQWVVEGSEPRTPLVAYGLAVTGALLGEVDMDVVQERREYAAHSAFADSALGAAELAWLDGVSAWLEGDRAGIQAAGARLAQIDSVDVWHIDIMRGSLTAFDTSAAGDIEAAGRQLAKVEWNSAERFGHFAYGPYSPFLGALDRLVASEWLLASGDTTEAARLLTWHEAVLWGWMARVKMVNRMLEPIAYFRRARIAAGQGDRERAREYYGAFLARYDRPPDEHRAWIEEAEAALAPSPDGD